MNQLVDKIIHAMLDQVQKYGLELMQRYPNDLLVHDRAALEKHAVSGAKIAWMVGHSHTHLTVLGLHAKENERVKYLTNLSNDDRFYVIHIAGWEQFSLKEVFRKEFENLAHTAIPYARKGEATSFWLWRGKDRIGHITMEDVSTQAGRKFSAVISPVSGISQRDYSALNLWCQMSVVEAAHTLFVQYSTTWANPIALAA